MNHRDKEEAEQLRQLQLESMHQDGVTWRHEGLELDEAGTTSGQRNPDDMFRADRFRCPRGVRGHERMQVGTCLRRYYEANCGYPPPPANLTLVARRKALSQNPCYECPYGAKLRAEFAEWAPDSEFQEDL